VGNQKEAVLVDDCGSVETTPFDEWSGEDASVSAAVDVFDGLDGDWRAVDACEAASMSVTIMPCDHKEISVVDTGDTCGSLAFVTATVVVSHPTFGTLTFPMEGTLNDSGWNVVDIDGVADEDDVRLSLTFDGEGGVIGSFLRTDGEDDASCHIEDFAVAD
jgi:hypothetical protein